MSHPSDMCKTQVSTCRIPLFAPTRRPISVISCYVETSWGSATITGRLGQQHRDLLDALMLVAIEKETTLDGRLHIKVDPAKLRAKMNEGEGSETNLTQIKKLLEDLRLAQVDLTYANRNVIGGIISEYDKAKCAAPTRHKGAFLSDEVSFWRISFSTGWSRLIADNTCMIYSLNSVMGLRYGFSQAVARFCLSHQSVNQNIESLMQVLAASGRLRDRKDELKRDSELLAKIGITIEGNMVKYRKRATIFQVENKKRDHIPGERDHIPGERDHIPGKNGVLSDISGYLRGGTHTP